jgi:histidyl-tRNA synthetase
MEGLEVLVNTVGSAEDRPKYREALIKHFEKYRKSLCGDCQRRLEQNPMRLLDCKNDSCQPAIASAPALLDHLGEKSVRHFETVKGLLGELKVPFQVDPRLVRGLDYYTATVFEIRSRSPELGTQSAIVGGGRYDELVESLGGPKTPAVGFALGIERNVMSVPEKAWRGLPVVDVFFATRGEAARRRAMVLAGELRGAGLRVDLDLRDVSLKAQFKRAERISPRVIVTIGDDELAAGTANVRKMNSREETAIPVKELAQQIQSLLT